MRLSIIMPVLDEGEAINAPLDTLAELRQLGVEVIAVDGGSRDATIQRARLRVDKVVSAPRGRVSQFNAGAAAASGDVLLFVHPGLRLPAASEHLMLDGLERSGKAWGHFDMSLEGHDFRLPAIAWFFNMWSRLTGVAGFDQAIFVKREAFEAAGRFPSIPLMWDVALSKRLKQKSRPLCLAQRVVTPGDAWEREGAGRTALALCRLRLAYYFGVTPEELEKQCVAAGWEALIRRWT
jgi:rSAM/selenodomain-associated transferase 2